MATKSATYIEAVGRRKMATARVRIIPSKQAKMTVNDQTVADYFKTMVLQSVARAALDVAGEKLEVTAKVRGGGMQAQAEAVRHALARAITERTPELRKDLKRKGFLKRDPRTKERKKFGLVAARRAPQWSKR
ncbi:30S ribosomal protein S9 [Candidatus Kaiserbacteria bacterium]|nr:30S ribosomal protein S9 [Candidatus Kaiserbacteria bacterium]